MKARLTALFCALMLTLSLVPGANAMSGDALRAADTLATLQMVNGNQNGHYALEAPATRAHAAVLLVRLSGSQKQAASSRWSAGLRDLPRWCAREINYVLHTGWLQVPYEKDFFPDQTISADAWCAALLRLTGYTDKDFDAGEAALFAQHIGLTSRLCTDPVTRGRLFETGLEALTFPGKEGTPLIQTLVRRGVVSRSAASALGLLEPRLTARQVADRHMAAVFQINCFETESQYEMGAFTSNASGFFITPDGVAVTNDHSIKGSSYGTAKLSTGEEYPIERVIWHDGAMDLALIKVSRTSLDKKTTSAFATLEMTRTDEVRPGDTVYSIGNPLGMGLAVSQGVISDVGRMAPGYLLPCILNTADISHGSSGGALFDACGRVIAVTAGAYIKGNSMYLAVPVDILFEEDWTAPGQTMKELAQQEAAKRPTPPDETPDAQ